MSRTGEGAEAKTAIVNEVLQMFKVPLVTELKVVATSPKDVLTANDQQQGINRITWHRPHPQLQ